MFKHLGKILTMGLISLTTLCYAAKNTLHATGNDVMRHYCFPIDYTGPIPPGVEFGIWKAGFTFSLEQDGSDKTIYLNISNGFCTPQHPEYGTFSIVDDELNLCNRANSLRLTFKSSKRKYTGFDFSATPSVLTYEMKLRAVCVTPQYKKKLPFPNLLQTRKKCICKYKKSHK